MLSPPSVPALSEPKVVDMFVIVDMDVISFVSRNVFMSGCVVCASFFICSMRYFVFYFVWCCVLMLCSVACAIYVLVLCFGMVHIY